MTIKVVSVLNMKGGVGKTTLAVNLAYALAYVHKMKVLLIDIDPQFNATQYLIDQEEYISILKEVEKGNRLTVRDIFSPREAESPSVVFSEGQTKKHIPLELKNIVVHVWSNGGKLDLIPSDLELMSLNVVSFGAENKIRKFVRKIRDAYDIIIIDCPPTLSIFTLNGYLACDAILVPVKPDWLSTIGLPILDRVIEKYEEDFGDTYELDIKNLGIVFTMVDVRTNLMNTMMERIRKDRKVFKHFLRQSTSIAEAVYYRKPFFLYRKAERHWKDILGICDELIDTLEEDD